MRSVWFRRASTATLALVDNLRPTGQATETRSIRDRGIYYGIEQVKQFYVKSMSALGVRWIVDTCYATDEGFAIAWHMGGIHDADLPGMPATGKFFTVPGASIARVKNGKIVRNRDFWNNLDLLKQLGLK